MNLAALILAAVISEGQLAVSLEPGQLHGFDPLGPVGDADAAAIDEVRIEAGEARPVKVEIEMNNSAGIFQVDSLLASKLRGSGLEPYVEVIAHIDTDAEKRLVQVYKLET